MIEVNEHASFTLVALWIDEDIAGFNIPVKDACNIVQIAMSC